MVETQQDHYVEVQIWTSSLPPTKIWYPKSPLSTMGSETMPHPDVFREVESLEAKDRRDFWCGQGGEHMTRFSKAEHHLCHLLFKMWHDFQQLDATNQHAYREQFVTRTYQCLSKAKNPTRVIRQLQAFAHFVCDGGETYIEPSKFIQCHGEVVSQRPLFKKLVQRVLERVKQSEGEHQAAVDRVNRSRAKAPSGRVLDNTSVGKQSPSRPLVVSIALCESVAKEVLAEHPLIGRVVSAKVKEGLPCYTIEPKDNASPSSGQEQEYSYDALAVREENRSLLTAYNKKWRKDVASIGLQIHPVTKQWDATVTWKSDSKVVLVSRRFFEVVDWEDYYDLIPSPALDDDEKGSAPVTPLRSTASSARYSSSLSSGSATPLTPAEKTAQEIHELVDRVTSKGLSERLLRAVRDRLEDIVKKLPSMPANETEKDTGSEHEDEEEEGNGSISEGEEEAARGEEDAEEEHKEAEGEEEAQMDVDDEAEGDDDESRTTRGSKRKAKRGLTAGRAKRAISRNIAVLVR